MQRADALPVEAKVLGEGLRDGEFRPAVRARGEVADGVPVVVDVACCEALAVRCTGIKSVIYTEQGSSSRLGVLSGDAN